MNDWDTKINDLFLNALEPQGAERLAFLDKACGDDAALRRAVEEMLVAHDQAGSFLDVPAAVRRAQVDDAAQTVPPLSAAANRPRDAELAMLGPAGRARIARQPRPLRGAGCGRPRRHGGGVQGP